MELGSIQSSLRLVEIKHPKTNENIGLRVAIQPSWAEDVRRVTHDNSSQLIVANREGRDQTFEEREAASMRFFAAIIVGWDWYDATLDGEKPELSLKAIETLFKRFPWIRIQVDNEAAKDKDFFSN